MSSTRKKAKTSEGTAKEGTDSAQELMVEESKELLEEVRVMNEKQISEGKYMLNVMIPDKISQIDSYIKNNPLFAKSLSEITELISVNTEQGDKQVREVKKKISKFNKRVEKDFGKWREENDVTCASLERNQKKRSHEAMESTSKQEHLESVVFNKEDAFPINPLLVDITDYLKQEVRDAVPIFNALRLWILLRIPRMEDGNNFGVTIQKEFIKRLSDAQDQMEAIMDLLTQYYKKRGDAVTLMISEPSIVDYRQAVVEIDESQFYCLLLSLQTLRSYYLSIYDAFMKNLDRLQNPR
ncbi:hypothetical protein WA538_002213, partial [Blastocystis sp. DL]